MTVTTEAPPSLTFRSDMKVDLMQSLGGDHSVIAAARVSTDIQKSEQAWEGEASAGLINFLMKNRHMSPFEHVALTVRVEAPIFVFREWHRHRTQSYNEMSGRYTELMPWFYVPGPERPLQQVGKPGAYEFVPGDDEQQECVNREFRYSCREAWGSYQRMLRKGIAKEIAVRVLPTTTYSIMYATFNLRNALQFLSLRTKDLESLFPSFPQYEIEKCANQVEDIVQSVSPLTHRAWADARRF
jgi:thymidylate synthase (FAD)